MRITEAQLKRIIRKIIKEQTMPTSRKHKQPSTEECISCHKQVPSYDISPEGICDDCDWENTAEEDRYGPTCQQCGRKRPKDWPIRDGICFDCERENNY